MEKTVKIGKKSVRLSNNISWAIIYRDQFGTDIVPTLMPMLAGAVDVLAGVVNETGKTGDISIADIASVASGDAFIEAMAHLAGLEFVDFINITWSMAKACDDDIPEPIEWVKGFDAFPLDVIFPAVAKLIFEGCVSSKNLKRLKDLGKSLQPKLTSTQSSSPDSNED